MSMSVGSAEAGAPMMKINTTPLIDVMLVLIIVLIMSIPVMTHATKLDMPQTNNPPPPVRPEVIQIDIDFDGTSCGTVRSSAASHSSRAFSVRSATRSRRLKFTCDPIVVRVMRPRLWSWPPRSATA